MVDVAAAANVLVMCCLCAVAVGIEQEAAVVLGAVLRPLAGPAVVRVTGVDASLPETIDLLARGGYEPDVQMPGWPMVTVTLDDGEVIPLDEIASGIARLDPKGA